MVVVVVDAVVVIVVTVLGRRVGAAVSTLVGIGVFLVVTVGVRVLCPCAATSSTNETIAGRSL